MKSTEKRGGTRRRKPAAVPQKYGSTSAAAEAFRAWKQQNSEVIDVANQQRSEAALGKANAWNARARAKALGALPSWAIHEDIEKVYAKAARLGLEVDHIIPLRGKEVCGLHVEDNLRLLTKLENQRKGNRFDQESDIALIYDYGEDAIPTWPLDSHLGSSPGSTVGHQSGNES